MSPSRPVPPKKTRRKAKPKLSPLRKPEGMSLEEWQVLLRRQFGREQKFRLKNLGERPAFSDFLVNNPQSRNTYRVTVRGRRPGQNSCTCPDFATNSLGTCKHVEFVLARLERKRESARELKAGYRPENSEIYLRYGALRDVCFIPAVDAAPELLRLAAKCFTSEGTLRPEASGEFDEFLTAARAIEPGLRCGDDVLGYLAEVRDAAERSRRVAEAFPRGSRSAAFKDVLRVPLYDYQREGALFAARAGRCLIGDEMGLGKTVQALAAAEIMARLYGIERVLIICPTSLKHQWRSEIDRFTNRTVRVVEGLRPRRGGGVRRH